MNKIKFYIDVALFVPVRQTFTYLPLINTTIDDYKIGARIQVPFGKRRLIGIVNKIVYEVGGNINLKQIFKVIDNTNVLSSNIFSLSNFAAKYYHHPIGEAYAACMPAAIKKGNDLDEYNNKLVLLNTDPNFILDHKTLTKAQKKVIELLQENSDGMSTFALKHLGIKKTSINSLAKNNWLYIKDRNKNSNNDKFSNDIKSLSNPEIETKLNQQPLELNGEQKLALDKINENLDKFICYLLYGITGSGKTEVYLQIIGLVLNKQQQVLILVPEISLTPQTINRFKNRFNTKIAVIHSKVSVTTKTEDWLAAKSGTANIIIGTRSAVFTPVKNLGLIIIDEEHDVSFKQQEGFRYNARDLAVIRAQQINIPIVLGTATPSLESVANTLKNKYKLLTLTKRAGNAVLPKIRLLNTKQKQLNCGLSDSLIKLIQNKLEQNQQVILFLNRRGYAPVLKCNDCSWSAICPRCNVHYTLHKQTKSLVCHYCMATKKLQNNCADCGSIDLTSYGVGTEQLEEHLNKIFPDYPCTRIDRDTTKNKGDLQRHLDQINENKPQILLGTQMLAKGHHFPKVTLVAVLDVDNSLFSTDFRAPERIVQLLLQVAGRAGRSELLSEVVIQTSQPEHELLQDILHKDYWSIATDLYKIRKIADQPPCTTWALIRAESYDLDKTMDFLRKIRDSSNNIISMNNLNIPNKPEDNISILGPIIAPRVKKAGLLRGQLLLSCQSRKTLHILLDQLLDKIADLKISSIRWSLDIDPQDVY